MKRRVLFFLSLISFSTSAICQSVFSDGNWYKIRINERGVYQLSYQYLRDNGVPVDNIDPRTIKIYGQKGGMLPQSNSEEWPIDPVEIEIQVIGESDGKFDNADYALFYAEDGDSFEYTSGQLEYEHNIYSDHNFYFLTYGGNQGKRMSSIQSLSEFGPVVNTYNSFSFYKEENNNLLTSGRNWYSFRFNTVTSQIINFQLPSIITGSEVKITTRVMAQSFENSSFNIYANSSLLGNVEVESVPDFNQRVFRYSIKGRENQQTFTATPGNGNIEVNVEYNKNSTHSIGFLDFVQVEAESSLNFSGDQIQFRSPESINHSITTFEISNAESNTNVWNVTDAFSPKIQNYSQSGSVISYNAGSETLQEYIAFETSEANTPANISSLSNQNLKSNTDIEFLIITHALFESEAIRLASFRTNNDGLTSKVVLIDEVYNEFSSGRQDITALRNYAKYLYDNGSLKYLLLFGRGSYDYKNTINNNTNFVPVYESRNSLHPLDTYASDDYFGFLEEDEGEWIEENGGNHTIDIGIGRFPVTTEDEAKSIVDKLIYYATSEATLGDWRNDVIFVADDGDFNLHQRQSDELTQFVDTTYSAFIPNKFFLDNFKQVSRPSGETSPAASEALTESVEKGALIVNFTGHGGENGWMQEQVLDLVQIQNWDNYDKLPLFVTATCEFGRHDDPQRTSGGELLVTSNQGGGIAVVSTCRPVSSSSNFALNKAFYDHIFDKESGDYLRLGDIFMATKNESINLATDSRKVGNRNFALLGDPTLRLNYPKQDISITGINEIGVKNDTLKALGKVKLFGQINTSNGLQNQSFNGEVSYVLYDKPVSKTTLGNENSPYTYQDNENIVFKGSSTVTGGEFQVEFVVPKNISYEVGNGRLNMYATNDQLLDANGADISLKIGDSNPTPPTDNKGPSIKLFMGDSLNTSLRQVSHNTNLVAILEDENGINTSSYTIGNSIIATLDDEIEYNLNAYYRADKDSYQRGVVTFPFKNLSKGKHTIRLKAWDTFNNSSESVISFEVADPNAMVIYDIYNYPNPFNDFTTFGFSHNKSGDDLEVELQIFSPVSGLIFTNVFNIDNSQSTVEFYNWEGRNMNGEKLKGGIYIYRLNVRSKRDGAKNSAHKKLILIN
ncbi:MAG: type IX secretion system sortase PorU [Fulvivirga sp.]|uniref:type IX secretion system sortase PorU n=1 Tax=Fulvivirga sp. TaxID=1931237 RepID=UPI0032F00312